MQPRSQAITVEPSGAFVDRFTLEPTGSGPLDGLTFAVKDIIDIAGRKTACGNPHWRDTHPVAVAHAVCVEQLLAAGGRCLGKTVTDELAFSLMGNNHFYGTPLNPKAPDRVPGGSSSGSASAVACGLVDFAIGTDTGGSVRVPASNCGIFGLRPSHGRISVAGVNPFAPTFDTVGVLAASADFLARAAAVLLACEIPSQDAAVGNIWIIRETFALLDPAVRQALAAPLQRLRACFGDRVQEISLRAIDGEPDDGQMNTWLDVYCTLQWAENWSCLGSWISEVQPLFGPTIRANFELAKSLDRRRIAAAVHRREAYFRRMAAFLHPHDVICIPTATMPARECSVVVCQDQATDDYYPHALSLTSLASVCRLPQISLPLAEYERAPMGLSLLAGHGQDAFLLQVVRQAAALLP